MTEATWGWLRPITMTMGNPKESTIKVRFSPNTDIAQFHFDRGCWVEGVDPEAASALREALNDPLSPFVIDDYEMLNPKLQAHLKEASEIREKNLGILAYARYIENKATSWCFLEETCQNIQQDLEIFYFDLQNRFVLDNLSDATLRDIATIGSHIATDGPDRETKNMGRLMEASLKSYLQNSRSHFNPLPAQEFVYEPELSRWRPFTGIENPVDYWSRIYFGEPGNIVAAPEFSKEGIREIDTARIYNSDANYGKHHDTAVANINVVVDATLKAWNQEGDERHLYHHGKIFTKEDTAERYLFLRPYAEAYMQKAGLPREMAALAIVEADMNNWAESKPAGAAGVYQLLSGVAKKLGLKVAPEEGIDERRNPFFSARAAAAVLAENKKRSLRKVDLRFDKIALEYN